MIVAVVAGIAMAVGDVFNALYVILLDRGRAGLAGNFDGLSDLTQVLSIGGGADAVYHHSFGYLTVLTLLFIYAGSVAGALVGNRLSARFTGNPVVTQSAIGG